MRKIAGIPDYNGVISGHFRSTPTYRIVRDSGTNDWLIIATVDGGGRFGRDRKDLPASAGDLTLIRPAIPKTTAQPEARTAGRSSGHTSLPGSNGTTGSAGPLPRKVSTNSLSTTPTHGAPSSPALPS